MTPDSFSDGGRHNRLDDALRRADRMIEEGAAVLDVGGESTRPGATPVEAHVERQRLVPFVREAARRWSVPISVDTRRAVVAQAALDVGASIVNDVSALSFDEAMAGTIAESGAGLILMHMRGTPQTMSELAEYAQVEEEVSAELGQRLLFAESRGIAVERVALDPGLGFAKTAEQSLRLVGSVAQLLGKGRPVVFGPSRKSFIGHVLGLPSDERIEGTIAASVLAYAQGARIFRVHDVGPVVRALRLTDAAVREAHNDDRT